MLQPEWHRLGIEPIGCSGFCALRLTQRLLDPVPAGNHKLQTLRQYYRLPQRGAHTALGDVETVVDLMQEVLQPLAEAQGLTTWKTIKAFTAAPWFPSRIAFGKYKGRPFHDALDDPQLHEWLEWLASSNNPRSAEMGCWYLAQLHRPMQASSQTSVVAESMVAEDVMSNSSGLVLFRDPEWETLRQLIANARARLADLEAEYTKERLGVEVVQSALFMELRPYYQRRDTLRLKIRYRRQYIDILLTEGEEEAEAVTPDYEHIRDQTERDYEDTAAEAAESRALSDDEHKELKGLFRKLVSLYHPDRFAQTPDKQEIHHHLVQFINEARDSGDIERLREIANDPNGFLMGQGLGGLDFSDEAELAKLQQLYDTLQTRILNVLADVEQLRDSPEYELYRLTQTQPNLMRNVADQQAEALAEEIAELETEAAQLAEEIEQLTGAQDHFHG